MDIYQCEPSEHIAYMWDQSGCLCMCSVAAQVFGISAEEGDNLYRIRVFWQDDFHDRQGSFTICEECADQLASMLQEAANRVVKLSDKGNW